MKSIICYATGGLANRVFPLASIKRYAELTNRKFLLYWPLDFRCEANFSSLYSNKIDVIDESYLHSLSFNTTKVFSSFMDTAYNDLNIYGRSFLSYKNIVIGEPDLNETADTIICCSNTFLNCVATIFALTIGLSSLYMFSSSVFSA